MFIPVFDNTVTHENHREVISRDLCVSVVADTSVLTLGLSPAHVPRTTVYFVFFQTQMPLHKLATSF